MKSSVFYFFECFQDAVKILKLNRWGRVDMRWKAGDLIRSFPGTFGSQPPLSPS